MEVEVAITARVLVEAAAEWRRRVVQLERLAPKVVELEVFFPLLRPEATG